MPYQGGGPATVAVLGGHTTILLGNVSEAAPFVQNRRLRAIAVTSLERSPVMRDVPTLNESGYPGFEAINWFGALAPAGTPRAVVERLTAEFARALDLPETKEGLARIGMDAAYMDPARFAAFMRGEMQTAEKVVREANIRME